MLAGTARQIDMRRAGGAQRLGGGDGLLGIDLVGGAQAGEFRAGCLEGRGKVGAASELIASMPPASKKFRANMLRAMKSAGAPRLARKIFGRAPVFFKRAVGSVAQCFERLGEPHRRQRGKLKAGVPKGCGATFATSEP